MQGVARAPEALPAPASDRTALWLPLLRRFTELSPRWVVWKNADAALAGVGDIDAAAPESDWPALEGAFREWATAQGVGPVVVCRHIPGGLNLVAVPPDMPTLLEVGMKARRMWRGATLFVLDDLVPLMRMDPRGFRRLRPGAEGLLKLLLNGVAWGGRPNHAALEAKGVVPLLREDPEGVAEAARRLLGDAADAAIAGAERAAEGGWDVGAMRAVELHALAQAVRSPRILGRRALFRARGKEECPVVAAILRDGRRIPADRAGWLARVATTHAVYAPAVHATGERRAHAARAAAAAAFTPEIVAELLRCPDDCAALAPAGTGEGDGYECVRCGRHFPQHRPNLLELLPSARYVRRPSDDPLVADSIAVYERLFAEKWTAQEDPRPWGHWETLPERMRRHYRRMRPLVEELAPAAGGTFLDISAGNGTLSLPLRDRFDVFLAADLSVAAVNWMATQPGVLALRTDYLRSPYRPGAFDFVLCTDTLVYGREHEEALLRAIWSAVAPGGSALLQFHHRLHHNPLTPPVTVGYTRDEILGMLGALRPAPRVELTPFFQEFDGNLRDGTLAAATRRVFPPTRYFATARKPAAAQLPPEPPDPALEHADQAVGPDQRRR